MGKNVHEIFLAWFMLDIRTGAIKKPLNLRGFEDLARFLLTQEQNS